MTSDSTIDEPIRILLVCTGNICRSPYAAFLLAGRLSAIDPGGFDVRSAGTHAMRGHTIDRSSAALLGPFASDAGDFTAAQLTATDVGRHDVVLTMTRDQRSAVLRLRPESLRRTFTLREYARLLDTLDPTTLPGDRRSRWDAMLPVLAANRTRAMVSDPAQDEVVDPYGHGPDVFRRMADEIGPAVDRIVEFERAVVGRSTPHGVDDAR